jgi:hypothetical protein
VLLLLLLLLLLVAAAGCFCGCCFGRLTQNGVTVTVIVFVI